MFKRPVRSRGELTPPNIRALVLHTLLTSVLGFLWYLARGKALTESLSLAGFLFLLIGFINIMWITIHRLKARGW